MTVELIQAIGQWIVSPIAIVAITYMAFKAML